MIKELSKKNKTIKVCNDCDKPIFYTFIFAGAEYYCPSCGASRDIFFGKDVRATPELIKLHRSLAIKFGQIKKHLVWGGGAKKKGCDKCVKEYHIRHLDKEELKKYKWAKSRLEEIIEHSI